MGFVISAEHASCAIPLDVDEHALTGAPNDLVESHFSFDAESLTIAQELSVALDAPLVSGNVSRLVVDLNRPRLADALAGERYGMVIGNAVLSEADRQRREAIHRKHYDAVAAAIDAALARAGWCVLLSVHTFEPCFSPSTRLAVDLGLVHRPTVCQDAALAKALCAADAHIMLNKPYSNDNDPVGIGDLADAMRSRYQAESPRVVSLLLEWRQRLGVVRRRELARKVVGVLRRDFGATKEG